MASLECNHPTCSGASCRRPKKQPKVYVLKRTPLKKKPYVIKKVADKRAEVNKVYRERSAAFRKANPKCEIQSPECTGKTEGVHHVKGKISHELLIDETYWMAACNRCNQYVESHDEWARANGFKLSKFN